MNRLEKTITSLQRENRKALVGFITAGYPDLRSTVEIVGTLAANGVDIIELGIPFSDPVADGPTIQESSQYALDHGVTFDGILKAVEQIRKTTDIPLVFMSYLNPLLRHGIEKMVRLSKESGVDGFIIPDIIPEEAGAIRNACRENDMSMIFLAAPNTPRERLSLIDAASSGFVYVVSLTGVTGARELMSKDLRRFLEDTKKHITEHPRFLGFGISKPEHVRQVKDHVDGVIVGSAFVNIIRRKRSTTARRRELARFTRSMSAAIKNR